MAAILHVISGLGVGGAETMLVRLAIGLQRRGHPQRVVSLNGRGVLADVLERGGVPVTDIAVHSIKGAFAGLWRLQRVIDEMAPDVVQGWMYHGNLAATFAHFMASRTAMRSLYWNLRSSNMDGARYGNIIRWSARLSRLADCIIVNSQAGASFHIAQRFDAGRFEIVRNGIDTDKFRPAEVARSELRAEYKLHDNVVLAIHVARVDPMKDHATFLRAMQALPHIQGLLVGAGTEALSLPANVRAIGLHADVERFYPMADIVVSSSVYGEGFSNTIAEGMSAALVPVATDVGDAGLIVGDAGRIVPPGDATALAAALADIAALAPSRRAALGAAARRRIVDTFAIDAAVTNYEKLYLRP